MDRRAQSAATIDAHGALLVSGADCSPSGDARAAAILHELAVELLGSCPLEALAHAGARALARLLPGRGVHVQVWSSARSTGVVEASGGPEMTEELHGEPLLAPEGQVGEIVVDAAARSGELDESARQSVASLAHTLAIAAVREIEREEREREGRALPGVLAHLAELRGGTRAEETARLAALAGALARELPIDAAALEQAVCWTSTLELLLPDALLLRREPLQPAEESLVRTWSERAATALDSVAAGRASRDAIGLAAELLLHADERWDGLGPRGLAGESISLGARIVSLARTWLEAGAEPGADGERRDLVRAQAGTLHDPAVVAALLRCRAGDARTSARHSTGPNRVPPKKL